MKKVLASVLAALFLFSGCASSGGAASALKLNQNRISKLSVSWDDLSRLKPITTTDKKQIADVASFLESLSTEAVSGENDAIGGYYKILITYKDNSQKTIYLQGNRYLKADSTYKVPYDQIKRFDTVVSGLLQKRETDAGESALSGTVLSVKSGSGGATLSFALKYKDGKIPSVVVKDDDTQSADTALIFDSTGNGNQIVHTGDEVKVFFDIAQRHPSYILLAKAVFITKAVR